MFNTIVVGVDGREGGRDALSLAGRLAVMSGGSIVAVRVLPFDYYVARAGAPPYASIAQPDAEAELQEELSKAEITARIRVMGDTSPARALHRVAEEERADLIVVGSTHHGRVGRVLAGDDAAATVHGSSCAVAVAPRGLAGREWKALAHIGVGVDGRAESLQALALACELARGCGATIKVRAVAATPLSPPEAAPYDSDWLEHAQAATTREMRAVLAGLDRDFPGEVVAGIPVDKLVAFSSEVDLLVVGSRAWGPVRRILVGSTAASLMRAAHCPVLVLPRGAATGEPGEQDHDHVHAEATATA
jgi:nucleotide-binding universal stress UspA family protein